MNETVQRPWGSYTVVELNEKYQIKTLCVKPGQSLSLQLHNHREEYWQLACGTGEVTVGEETYTVTVPDRIHIPLKTKHRIRNCGSVDIVIIELQLGDSFDENDIVRFEDCYGRA